jgi:hypothetical protein
MGAPMTSAVTVLSIASATAQAVSAVPAVAAGNATPATANKPGESPPVPKTATDPPETEITKSTHIAVQVSNALLGLSMTAASNSPTAPDAVQSPPRSATAMTELAIRDPAASQGTDNHNAGADTSDFQGSGHSQNAPGNATQQSAASKDGNAGSQAGNGAKAESVTEFSPLPVIPQWHIRPRTKLG